MCNFTISPSVHVDVSLSVIFVLAATVSIIVQVHLTAVPTYLLPLWRSGVRHSSSESIAVPSPVLIAEQIGKPQRQYGTVGTPYLTPAGSVTGKCAVQLMLWTPSSSVSVTLAVPLDGSIINRQWSTQTRCRQPRYLFFTVGICTLNPVTILALRRTKRRNQVVVHC